MKKRTNAVVFLYDIEEADRYYNLSNFFFICGSLVDEIVSLNNGYDSRMWNSNYDLRIDLTGKLAPDQVKWISYPTKEKKNRIDDIKDLLKIMAQNGYYNNQELEILNKVADIYIENNLPVLEYLGRNYWYIVEKESDKSPFYSYYDTYKKNNNLLMEYESSKDGKKFLIYTKFHLIRRMQEIAKHEYRTPPFDYKKFIKQFDNYIEEYSNFWTFNTLKGYLADTDSWGSIYSRSYWDYGIKRALHIYKSEDLPFLSSIYYKCGCFYERVQNGESLSNLNYIKAINQNPNYYSARYKLARYLDKSEKYDEALTQYSIVQNQLERFMDSFYLPPNEFHYLFYTYYCKKLLFQKKEDDNNVSLMNRKIENMAQFKLEDSLFFYSFFGQESFKYSEFVKSKTIKKLK